MPPGLGSIPRFFGSLKVQPADLDPTLAPAVKSVSGTYQMTTADCLLIVTTNPNPATVTLPPANQIAPFGRSVRLVKLNRINTLTVLPAAGDAFYGGVTSEVLYNEFSVIELMSDGAHAWYPFPTMWMAGNMSSAIVTTTYLVQDADYKIFADATAAPFTITLPQNASFAFGHEFRIEKIDVSANAVTVAATGSDTIEGSATVALSAQYNTLRVTANGVTPGGIWYKL